MSGPGKLGAKPKGKARAEGLELLANATLKLKAGIHYALIGRNGTGKSSESVLRVAIDRFDCRIIIYNLYVM